MPSVEGRMSPEDTELLREALGIRPDALAGIPIFTSPPYQTVSERTKPETQPQVVTSGVILTKRAIPIIGTEQTEEVWLKGK